MLQMSPLTGSFDAVYISQQKKERTRLPEPSLPNGQRPDFGNGYKPKRNHNNTRRNPKQIQAQGPASQPQGKLAPSPLEKDFKSQPSRDSTTSARKANDSNKNSPQSSDSRKNNNNKNKTNSKKETSPLGSPKLQVARPAHGGNTVNYSLHSTGNFSVQKTSSYAGSRFSTLAPDVKAIPKPSFL